MLQILYVDDEPVLLEVAKEFLEDTGLVKVDVFESVDAAEVAMQEKHYDAVISDYQMPNRDGIQFLKKLRSEGNRVPFILFTGRGREEVVIEALNSGAQFYLQKGGEPKAQFAELLHKVRTAVERKASEDKLLVANIELQAALDIAKLAAWNLNFETGSFCFNDKMWALHGTDAGRENGYTMSMVRYAREFIHPDDANYFASEVMKVIQPDSTVEGGVLEYRMIRRDGAVRQLFVNYGIIRDGKGHPLEAHGASQDVTDRLEDKARLNRLNRELMAIKEINKAIVRAGTEDQLLDEICRLAVDLAGYSLVWVGMRNSENMVDPVAASCRDKGPVPLEPARSSADPRGPDPMTMAVETEVSVVVQDWRRERRFASWRPHYQEQGYRSTIAIPLKDPVSDSAQVIGALVLCSTEVGSFSEDEVSLLEEMANDLAYGVMSIRAQTQKRKAEAHIRESEERYRSLVDSTFDGVVISVDGVLVDVNNAGCKLFGYPREELIGMNALDLFTEASKPIFLREIKRSPPGQYEAQLRRKDGQVITIEVNGRNMFHNGKLARLAAVKDITERRRAERELRASEQRFEDLAQQQRTIVWEVDRDGLYTYMSNVAIPVLGLLPEEVVGRLHFYDLHPEEGREDFKLAAFTVFAQKGEFSDLINPVQTKDGKVIWVSTSGLPILGPDGELAGYKGSDTDVTERKRAEDALQESERRYRSVVDRAAEAIVVIQDGAIRFANRKSSEITGYSEEEIISKPFADFIHADDKAMVVQRHLARVRGEPVPDRYDFRLAAKDGSLVWVAISSIAIDWNGRPAALSLISDITDRKRAEELLRESEKKYRMLAENINDVIWRVDLQTQRFLYVSPSVQRLRGFTVEEVMNQSLKDLMTPEAYDRIQKALMDHLPRIAAGEKGAETFIGVFDMRRTDGRTVPAEVVATLVKDPETGRMEILGITRDITARLRAERSLKEKTEELAHFFRLAPDLLGISSLDGRLWEVNPAWTAILGFPAEELVDHDISELIHPDDLVAFRDGMASLGEGKIVTHLVIRLRDHRGEYHSLDWYAVPHRGLIYAAARDVTELQEMSKLQRNEARMLHTILDIMPSGLHIVDRQGRLIAANKRMLEIFARPEDEALGKNAADLLGSAGAEYSALLERVVAAKTGSAISYKDHGHDHLLKLLPVLSDEGEVEWICAVVTEFRPAGHGR